MNLLARDSAAMQRLSALGRELRDAQTGLAGPELRKLAGSDACSQTCSIKPVPMPLTPACA